MACTGGCAPDQSSRAGGPASVELFGKTYIAGGRLRLQDFRLIPDGPGLPPAVAFTWKTADGQPLPEDAAFNLRVVFTAPPAQPVSWFIDQAGGRREKSLTLSGNFQVPERGIRYKVYGFCTAARSRSDYDDTAVISNIVETTYEHPGGGSPARR
jgi:hypothetical protein